MSPSRRSSVSFAPAFAALTALLALAGCGELSIPEGKLGCGPKGECPSGFTCRKPENKCYKAGGTAGTGGTAGAVGTAGTSGQGGDGGGGVAGSGANDGGAGVGEPDASAGPCPALTNPDHGVVATPSVISGGVATYSCDLGYTLTGEATRTCQAGGAWNGAAPTCVIKDCGPLTPPAKGTVDAKTTTYGAVATYGCETGLAPSGSSTRRCQLDGMWDGMAPACVVANCPALPGPTSGSVSAPTLTFGSTANYACDSGYTLTGSATRTCKTDGTWSDTAPTCTIKNCGVLAAPTNGSVNATGANYGATGTYACDTGYTLSGAATVMCQTDGAWSASAPTCALKNCGALTMPANGSVNATVTTYGSTASYACSTGYVLTGAATRTCGATGAWSGAAPTCVLKDCGALTAPANGSVDAKVTTFGATAMYTCMTGYGASGSATRSCTISGWDGTAPTCVIANCPSLAGPAGGSVSAPMLTFGSTATYSCNTGYDMAGTATRMCQAAGTWSGTAPTCTIKNCGTLVMPTNGSVTAATTTYGATATYACVTGYGLAGTATRTCQADGMWSGAAPTCAIKNCGTLAGPTNGTVTATTTTYGSAATYACNTGYGVVGTATRACQADGTWSGTAPTCALRDCGALTNPANGMVSAPVTTYNSTATYSCITGYGPSGSTTRTCQANGTWSGTAPTCVIANCPALPNPSGGSVSAPLLTYGATATYGCNAGYDLVGATMRTCQANGTWSGAPPTCSPKDCGAPPKPTNGNATYTTTVYMSQAMYSCSSGYMLSGATTRSCQSDGTWSATTPTCPPVDCGVPPAISNGSASYSGTTYGSNATYTCGNNYVLSSGTGVIGCLATAKWATPTPACAELCSTGATGSASYCCKDAACSGATPKCNTTTHACVAKSLGDACTSANQCGSGYCAYGVCCNSACTGSCNSGCSAGTCDPKPARTSCGMRTGVYPGYNDIYLMCDGAGTCSAPKVRCGSTTSCDLNTNFCCMTSPGSAATLTYSCVTALSCNCGSGACDPQSSNANHRWDGCASSLDCPVGMICAVQSSIYLNLGFQYFKCIPEGGLGNTWTVEQCDPTRGAGQCMTPYYPTCYNSYDPDDPTRGYCN